MHYIEENSTGVVRMNQQPSLKTQQLWPSGFLLIKVMLSLFVKQEKR